MDGLFTVSYEHTQVVLDGKALRSLRGHFQLRIARIFAFVGRIACESLGHAVATVLEGEELLLFVRALYLRLPAFPPSIIEKGPHAYHCLIETVVPLAYRRCMSTRVPSMLPWLEPSVP